jgi:hypothetical protein
MNNLLLMSVLERLNHLVNVVGGPGLREFLLVLEDLVKLAVRCIVQNNVDTLVVEEEPVHGQNVWVF